MVMLGIEASREGAYQLYLGADGLDLREHDGQHVISLDGHHEQVVGLHHSVELFRQACASHHIT